jgi:hypothetical protein
METALDAAFHLMLNPSAESIKFMSVIGLLDPLSQLVAYDTLDELLEILRGRVVWAHEYFHVFNSSRQVREFARDPSGKHASVLYV